MEVGGLVAGGALDGAALHQRLAAGRAEAVPALQHQWATFLVVDEVATLWAAAGGGHRLTPPLDATGGGGATHGPSKNTKQKKNENKKTVIGCKFLQDLPWRCTF